MARVGELTVAVKDSSWPKTDGVDDEVSATVVGLSITVCVSVLELFWKKAVLLLTKLAVMVFDPAGSVEVEKVACPPVRVDVPRVTVPELVVSVNCTEPLGEPPDDETIAVKVTDCPTNDGFIEEESTVVVGACTDSVKLPVTALLLVSVTVTVWLPAMSKVTPLVKVWLPASTDGLNV